MKAKFLFILLSLLLIVPTEDLMAKNENNRRVHINHRTNRRDNKARSIKLFNMSVQEENDILQILFHSPLPDAEIIITDKDGNTVIDESHTSIFEGKILYIYTPDAYPYTIRITSPILDVTGEIIQDDI